MEMVQKAREWVKENAPMLSTVYENKYVGMAYDRFASLPAKQQKQLIVSFLGGVLFLAVGYLLYAYIGLWYLSNSVSDANSMIHLLQQHQQQRNLRNSELSALERNIGLTNPGQFKQLLIDQGKLSGISPRLIEVIEKTDGADADSDGKAGSEVRIKQATVTLNKINLTQLKSFLTNVEFGQNNLGISFVKVSNDDKTRGYMKVELGILAYLFQSEEAAP